MKQRDSKILFIIIVFLIICLATSLSNKISDFTYDNSFRLLMSSENSDLESLVKDYFKKKKINVKITYAGTLDLMDKINANEEDYDAIWASNSIWLYMLNNSSIVTKSKSTSINPIVFGVKKPLATSLNLTEKEIYTKDILDKINSKELQFVISSPIRTNTGASAYLGFLGTLAGNPEVLTSEHLKDETLKNNITIFLSGVERTSGSEEFLDELLTSGNYNAVVSYESSLINLNKKLEKEGKEPFYLIYPVDGVTISDSPLAYINNGNDKKEVFEEFQKYILSEEVQNKLASLGRRVWYGGINENADPKTFNKDWGIDTTKYIVPIKYPSKQVIREALMLYQAEFRKPVHTVFCLDYSGSMYGNGNEQLIDAMEYILNVESASTNMLQFSYKDKITIIPFSTNILGTLQTNDGTDTNLLLQRIKEIEPYGSTNLYGSLVKALEVLDKENSDYNLSIILMTDGQGNVGTYENLKNTFNRVNKDIPIYSILFGDADDRQLGQISSLTGGKVFDGTENLLDAFKEVRGFN